MQFYQNICKNFKRGSKSLQDKLFDILMGTLAFGGAGVGIVFGANNAGWMIFGGLSVALFTLYTVYKNDSGDNDSVNDGIGRTD